MKAKIGRTFFLAKLFLSLPKSTFFIILAIQITIMISEAQFQNELQLLYKTPSEKMLAMAIIRR